MATIQEKRDKNGEITAYKLVCCVGRDEHRKQIWRTKTIRRPDGLTPARERKEVQRLAAEWEASKKADWEKTHCKADRDRMPFDEFVRAHWLPDHVHDGQHTPSSIQFFENTIRYSLDFFGAKKIATIDGENVKRLVNFLRNDAQTQRGQPLSATTVQHAFSTFRNVMEYAARMHYIERDPCQDLAQSEKPRREKKRVDFLTPDEARRFLKCLDGESLFWKAFENILITTGVRRGEAVGLQWGDLDFEKMTISVQRNVTPDRDAPDRMHIGATKTGETRTVPVSRRVLEMLLELKREREAALGVSLLPQTFVFCRASNAYKPINPQEPTRWQRRFVQRHGLPNVSPHDLRHTAATLALESGADLKQIQQLLGHRDASTTLQFYAGVTEERQRQTVEGIENLLA